MTREKVVIIGNGIAGVTAARTVRKMSDHEITMISSESDHFFSRTALMYIYMGHQKFSDTKPYEDHFWAKNRINLRRDHVEKIDTASKHLNLRSGEMLAYNHLVIATGSQSFFIDWPGSKCEGVQGLYSLQDLELMEAKTKNVRQAVIVGGGLIGVEMAEMLHSRGIAVTFLIRENAFSRHFLPLEEAEMINRHVREYGIDLRPETEIQEVRADDRNHVRSIITKSGEEIPCQFLGVTVGVKPRIELAAASGIETARGILVDERLRTSIDSIFAAGDCAELRKAPAGRRPVEPVWYVGKMQGAVVGKNICGADSTYDPGLWYNSAKFFDIEYQVYGDIRPNLPAEQETLYWEDPSGKKSIRINFEKESETVLGFNLMGVRYRHDVCDRWIRERATIHQVLPRLREANFDPEFFPRYEREIIDIYNRNHPPIPLERTWWERIAARA